MILAKGGDFHAREPARKLASAKLAPSVLAEFHTVTLSAGGKMATEGEEDEEICDSWEDMADSGVRKLTPCTISGCYSTEVPIPGGVTSIRTRSLSIGDVFSFSW